MKTQTVLITGASTGIGACCARHLHDKGFRVFAGVRRKEDGERLRAATSERLTPIAIDVTDADTIIAARDGIARELGEDGLGGLFNNAGITVIGPMEFVPLDDLRQQLEVNVVGQIAVTQAFLPLLRRAPGRIVNNSSMAGRMAAPLMGPYSMSKFAVEAFSDALRRELRPWDIQVSCIEPGAIDTPIWNKALEAPENQPDELPLEAQQLYGSAVQAIREAATQSRDAAVSPTRVAEAVHHALTARRPKTRYLIGTDARIAVRLARFLPDRWLDVLVHRMSGI
jgi:NAD(P)-dependent dehydrogenase (short-subunit alcohol dehydrogenase family)